MESRYYPGVEADVIKLMTELRSLFDEDFDVQTMQVSSAAVLQARKSSTLREITGLSAALTIKVTPETGGTRVEIGAVHCCAQVTPISKAPSSSCTTPTTKLADNVFRIL